MFRHNIYWAKGVGLSLSKYCKIDIFVNNRLIKTRTFEFKVTVHFGLPMEEKHPENNAFRQESVRGLFYKSLAWDSHIMGMTINKWQHTVQVCLLVFQF